MVSNTTVLFNFDHAALVAAGKSYDNASDLIFTRGGVEIDAINLTPWNTANVLIGFRTNTSILRGAVDDTNYSILYGGDSWTVPNRYRNASRAFTWADDFTRSVAGATLNATGSWWENSATYSAYQLEPGTMTFHTGAGWWNVLAQDRWAFPTGLSQYNTSVVGRFKNETGMAVGAIQYIGGRCGTNNTVNCGGGSEMAWFFNNNAGTNRLRYGINTAATTAISPVENKWYFTDMRFGPNSTPTQFWRSSGNLTTISSNPGNVSTVSNGTWYPAIGTDGSANVVNFTYDFFGVRYYSTLVDPSVQFGSEEINSEAVYIYYPLGAPTTYYNVTSFNVIWHLNSTVNSSSMMAWKTVNGATTNLGYLANGSTNTTPTTGFKSGYNSLSIYALESAVNASSTINVSVVNGLNISVYNASQATNTFLSGVNLTVWNTTNQSTFAATTPYSAETRTIPNGVTVNINATKDGYAPAWFDSYIYSNASLYYDVSIPLWRLQEFHLDSGNGTNVTTFNLNVFSSGLNSSYTTTNGTIQVSLGSLPVGTIMGQFVATGYNSTNQSFSVNSTSEINFTATTVRAGIIFYAYDEESCAISCRRIYFSFLSQNSTASSGDLNNNYFFNASYDNSSLVQGLGTYTFNNTINGSYYSRSYFLTVSSSTATILNAYLLNATSSSISATYCTVSANNPVIGATVTISRLFGSTYTTVAQGTTGSSGCVTFYLNSLITYYITASATGYTTFTGYAQPLSIQYLQLSQSATMGFQTQIADEDDIVIHSLKPLSNTLVGDWTLVNYTVYSQNGTITSWGLQCYYNGSSIYSKNNTGSPSGGIEITNITLTNKTNPTNFNCYGYFARDNVTGYGVTYLNTTYYILFANASYTNVSVGTAFSNVNNAGFTQQALGIIALVLTVAFTASVARFVPIGGGFIAIALISGFAFLGFVPILHWVLAVAATLLVAWGEKR